MSPVITACAVTVFGHAVLSVTVGGVALEYLEPHSLIFRLFLKLDGSNWSVAIAFEVGGSMLIVGILVQTPSNVMSINVPFSIFDVAKSPPSHVPPVLVISGAYA